MQIIFDALPPKNIFQLWFDLGHPDDGKKIKGLIQIKVSFFCL